MQITRLFSRDKDNNKEDYGNHNFFKLKKNNKNEIKSTSADMTGVDKSIEMTRVKTWRTEDA